MVTSVKATQTARERARAELTREIKNEARRQLAESGADGLSLRAVARSLGMVSSALYRYFPSRDDLLTALIIDAYNAIGDAAESAAPAQGARAGARGQWTALCRAVRAWALANPHEYALIYGSPVPGYRAPEATITPATRVPLAFVQVLRDALAAGELTPDESLPAQNPPPRHLPPRHLPPQGLLADQVAGLAAALAKPSPGTPGTPEIPEIPPGALVRVVIAWSMLFGMISFELFGQFVGSFDPADALFEHAIDHMATFVGLTNPARPLDAAET